MKKVLLSVLIFTIVAISITSILINIKSKENPNSIQDNGKINNIIVEKTLDLYGTYNENDIEIEKIYIKVDGLEKEIEIPVINGLKNKNVEEKVNNDIKNRIIEKIDEINKQDNSILNIYYSILSNFSNVLSIQWNIVYEKNDNYCHDIYGFNYELINGNKLKFEDLFVSNADLYSIVRRIYYRMITENEVCPYTFLDGEYYYLYDIHFDKEKNTWMGKYDKYDYNTNEFSTFEIEYIPELSEEKINQFIIDFMNDEEKSYYFTPAKLFIEGYYSSIEFKDIADEVVIYDKYLTEESLYEYSNIGHKNIWTCAVISDYEYMDYGFAEDNFYYDITTSNMGYNDEYYFLKSRNKLMEEKIEYANEKVEEYRKIANENPDKFYVLFIQPNITQNYTRECTSYLLFDNTVEYLAYGSITSKKEIMDEFLKDYRYYNLGFYGSALDFNIKFFLNESELFYDVIYKEGKKVYDARNLEEIKSVAEIFREDVDYINVIESILKSVIRSNSYYTISDEDLNSYVKKASYELDEWGIQCEIPDMQNREYLIYFSDIDKSVLKIYDLEQYIIPESDTRKIEKAEIEYLSLDELNKAYNEIFARHGHDFKSSELKEYFSILSWYNPEQNKVVSLEELNEVERYNLEIIKSVISGKK